MAQMANVPLDTASARPVRVAGHMRSPTVETGYRDKYSQRNLPLDGVAGGFGGAARCLRCLPWFTFLRLEEGWSAEAVGDLLES
jgi:hypothetical protein